MTNEVVFIYNPDTKEVKEALNWRAVNMGEFFYDNASGTNPKFGWKNYDDSYRELSMEDLPSILRTYLLVSGIPINEQVSVYI